MAHLHEHEHRTSPRVRRLLAASITPLAIATIVGLVLLWPGTPRAAIEAPPAQDIRGTVVRVQEKSCGDLPNPSDFTCSTVTARVDEGEDEGLEVSFDYAAGASAPALEVGDGILLGKPPGASTYFFVDYQRSAPLLILALIFAAVVVLLSRWTGVAALVGLAISLFVLIRFVLPAILEGSNPLTVSIVGAAAVMFVALYLAHGFNARTSTAILGTLASLLLTAALAYLFVVAARFTGFASEEAVFLQISAEQVNLRGLLLGGIIIGTLGVLDDVTVTQASAIWELHLANPMYSARQLYKAALRIGRDHIASTVNTLVLAYAGASLPLLIVFTLGNRSLGGVLTTEVVAEEVVRTLVGSIGLIASVPITTALGAWVVSHDPAP